MAKRRIIRLGMLFLFALSFFVLARTVYLSSLSIAPDFSVLWNGASALINGRNPYIEPNLFTGIGYPPNTLMFYLPLTILPYKIAQIMFSVASAFAVFVCVSLIFKIVRFKQHTTELFLLFTSLVILSFPTRFTLGMGQNNLLAFLLLLLSYYFFKQNRKLGSGFILGLAILFKTIFLIFPLFFLLKRQWKILIATICTVLLGFIVTQYLFGIELYEYYFREVVPPLLNLSAREIYYNQGFLGFVSRLTTSLATRGQLNTLFTIILISFVTFVTYKNRALKTLEDLLFSLFVTSLLLIDTLSWQHHFVWLIFPFMVLVKYAFSLRKAWFWGLLVFCFVMISWNFKTPHFYTEFPRSLFLSNQFYGSILLWGLNLYLIFGTYFNNAKIQHYPQ